MDKTVQPSTYHQRGDDADAVAVAVACPCSPMVLCSSRPQLSVVAGPQPQQQQQ